MVRREVQQSASTAIFKTRRRLGHSVGTHLSELCWQNRLKIAPAAPGKYPIGSDSFISNANDPKHAVNAAKAYLDRKIYN